MPLTLAQKLELFRNKNNLTKGQLAKRLLISSQRLGMYEEGERNPKGDFYEKWKEVFGFDLKEWDGKQIETNVPRATTESEDSKDMVIKLFEENKKLLEDKVKKLEEEKKDWEKDKEKLEEENRILKANTPKRRMAMSESDKSYKK